MEKEERRWKGRENRVACKRGGRGGKKRNERRHESAVWGWKRGGRKRRKDGIYGRRRRGKERREGLQEIKKRKRGYEEESVFFDYYFFPFILSFIIIYVLFHRHFCLIISTDGFLQ